MKSVDFLIVGGGVTGTTAAQTIRGLRPDSSVVILSDEPYELYSRILLTSYIRGEATQEQVFLKRNEWYQENRIDLVKGVSAQKLDANAHTVECANGDVYQYKKLLLALGARPIKLNVPGSELGNISYMWTIEDAEEVINALKGTNESRRPGGPLTRRGVVIGGGDLGWLEGSGIKIDQGIVTNEYLETNLGDVYAAGDCANYYDVIVEGQHLVGTWANAATQAVAVGKTMTGVKTVFEAVCAYTARFFESTCSFVGMTEADFADEVVTRGTVAEGKISRIFLKNYPSTSSGSMTRIVGAIIANNFGEVAPITDAIKNKVDVSQNRDKLADANFDLHSLPIS